MGTISNYILDGATVAQSTGVQNPNGTPAADGWYKDSSGVRYLTNGTFSSGGAVPCDCAEDCGNTIITRPTGTVSTDFFDFNTGQGAGVVVVRFTPSAVPVGIQVATSLPGVLPNIWSSTVSPYQRERIAAGPFFLGNTANDFGLVASSPWTNIVEREYYNGSYTNTGNLANYFVANGSLNLGATPGTLVLPISKPTSGEMNVSIAVTSLDTACSYTLQTVCPELILEASRFLSTDEGKNCNTAAVYPLPTYLISIQNPPQLAVPNAGDFLFTDNLATSYRADGQYVIHPALTPGTRYVVNIVNGVIITAGSCPP